jgi:hypothetical protein
VKHNGQYVPCMFDYSDRPAEEQDPGPDEADQCIFEESLAEVSRRGFKVNAAAIARRNKRRSMRMRKAVAQGHVGEQTQRRQEAGGRLKGGQGMTIKPTFREPGRLALHASSAVLCRVARLLLLLCDLCG